MTNFASSGSLSGAMGGNIHGRVLNSSGDGVELAPEMEQRLLACDDPVGLSRVLRHLLKNAEELENRDRLTMALEIMLETAAEASAVVDEEHTTGGSS